MRRIIISPEHSSPSRESSFARPDLIALPSEPIRQTWIRRYRLLEQKLDKMKKEWRLFEQDAQAEFQKWYHLTFAQELSWVNEWNHKTQEQQMVLAAIVAHQRIYQIDELEAFARVKRKMDAGQDPFPDQEDIDRYEKRQQEREEAEMRRQAERMKKLREEAEKFWNSKEDREEFQEAMEHILGTPEKKDAPSMRKDDLKSTYRSIVMLLHPDMGHAMTDIEKEWWNQAQEAYRNGDLELLKIIALKIQGHGKVSIENIFHIGTIIDLCGSLIEQQDEIKFQQRKLRKDPVYRFWSSRSRPQNREKLKIDLLAKLHYQHRKLKEFVAEVKESLHELEYRLRHSAWAIEDEDEERYYRREREQERSRGRGRGRSRR